MSKLRAERFTLDTDTFAAERKQILERSDERLREVVKTALVRLGLSRWKDPVVTRALEVFDSTLAEELDEPSQVVDDMRDEFERELRTALDKTKTAANLDQQTETITRWISTMAVNAGTEAAIVADVGEAALGLEWVTMADGDVRDSHQEANGQVVPQGEPFSVAGEELLYPGQPVGDPSVWINCRCLARPTMLTEEFKASVSQLTQVTAAAGDAEALEEKKNTSSVIVAVPANGDAIYDTSSEDIPHVTLLWLGDAADFDPEPIKAELDAYTQTFSGGPFDEAVASSEFTLGADGAEVVLLDAKNLATIRGAILASEVVRARHDQVEQFPTWIPHLTLGYPDTPKVGELEQAVIKFDRLALWHGDEKFVYPLAGNVEVVDAEGAEPSGDALIAAAPVIIEEEEPVIEGEIVEEEVPEVDQAEDELPVPWHGLLAPEGTPSGDKRMFALNALSNRDLPLPLKHMPADAQGHDGSFVVGRIDKIWKDEAGAVWGEGVFDYSPGGYEAIRLIAEEMMLGLSVDVDDVEGGIGEDGEEVYTAARVSAVTHCAIPAFAESKIFLGPFQEIEEDDVETVDMPIKGELASVRQLTDRANTFDIPPRKTKDGPGWITEPKPTKRITAYWVDGPGAPKIGWGAPGDFNRCRLQLAKYVQNPEWLAGLCANLHYRALGAWPGQASGKVTEMSNLVAAAQAPLPSEWFKDPGLTEPTRIKVTPEGRVFGHIATWDVCHVGVMNKCVLATPSKTNYSYFLTGEVDTDAGPVEVGQISMGGGHADLRLGVRAAATHYDTTSSAVADITVGEDAIGVWCSGAIRPQTTPEQIRDLRASGTLSGDWRRVVVGGEPTVEMIAALAVNVGGFPIPKTRFSNSSRGQYALVAAGIVEPSDEDNEFDAKVFAALERRERRDRAVRAQAGVRAFRAEQIKARVNQERR